MRVEPRGVNGCQPDTLSGRNGRFSRHLRLLKPAEFKQVFSKARKSTDENFTVLYITNRLAHPRLGMAIAKKQVRTAVARNRIKRVVRESFRCCQEALPAADIVVLARRGTSEKDKNELHRSLRNHWNRLGRQCVK